MRTLRADEIECRVGTSTNNGVSLLLYKGFLRSHFGTVNRHLLLAETVEFFLFLCQCAQLAQAVIQAGFCQRRR